MMREADAVPLGIADVERPARPVDHLDPGRREPLLPGAPLGRRDPEGHEVQPSRPVLPWVLLRRAIGPLQRDERRARRVAGREPDAPVARAPVVAWPAPEYAKPEHFPVEPLAALEVGALDREVVDGADHPRKVPPLPPSRHPGA